MKSHSETSHSSSYDSDYTQEDILTQEVIEKIRNTYREETGHTINFVRVHRYAILRNNDYLYEIIISREGKNYLLRVRIEIIDDMPVVAIYYYSEKEIR